MQGFDSITLFSGDLGNAVWATAGSPGQAQSCAQRTGVSTCEDFVRANGAALEQACEFVDVCMAYCVALRALPM